jgi:hypothetical protein
MLDKFALPQQQFFCRDLAGFYNSTNKYMRNVSKCSDLVRWTFSGTRRTIFPSPLEATLKIFYFDFFNFNLCVRVTKRDEYETRNRYLLI